MPTTRSGLHGHTHVPIAFVEDDGRLEIMSPGAGSRVTLDGRRVLLNPGSVGQPRDGIPAASWMLLDTDDGRRDLAADRVRRRRRSRRPWRLAGCPSASSPGWRMGSRTVAR